MSTVADLTNEVQEVYPFNDAIIIRHYGAGIKNGRTLDMTGFPDDAVTAGHVVIKKSDEEIYKPMPLNSGGTAYASLPSGYEYVGVVVSTKLAKQPFVGIMYAGEVNDLAVKYSPSSIKAAMKTALPNLVWLHD